MALASTLLEIFERPTIWEVMLDLMIVVVPLWIAVSMGVLVGWCWRPKWANFASNLCIASIPGLASLKSKLPGFVPSISTNELEDHTQSDPPTKKSNSSQLASVLKASYKIETGFSSTKLYGVEEADLRHLRQLVEVKDGGPDWIPVMDRSTPTMSYQAWRRDPQNGPPQYRSRTVFEDATPEIVRDFFWDDEFRFKWDDMLIQHQILEECSITGTMIVQWIRKFPFFCSDREYIIGRRIWDSNRSYYCVTKGVPYSSVPRHNKARRVDLYYSSWCIRPAESQRDGQMTACEVLLFHHEEMGIPWEIAKLGVRQGMWTAVKKIDPGLRIYQKERSSGAALSRCALMSQINTKITATYLKSLEEGNSSDLSLESVDRDASTCSGKQSGMNIPKLLVIGTVVAVAFGVDQGLLTKAVIFGVARRFARIGRRL